MITFENLSFSYGNTGEEQLNSLDLQIKKGEFVLLCGRSACGKTTATKCINGLIPHFTEGKYSGSVVVKEKEIAKTPVYEISEDVGSVFQNPKTQFFNLDSDSELVFGMENLGIEPNKINARVQEVAHGLKIENLLGRSVFGLSGGEKQILALASIYAVNPDIYVLDEPTGNIDKDGIDRLHEILLKLKQMGKTIVISEHRLYFLMDLVDKAVYIEHGVIQKVYTGDEFRALADSERIRLGLRCFTLDNEKDEVPTKCNSGILEIDNLSVSYKNRTIFSNASFAAARGDIIAVTGRNGSGKSAFLRVLCGLMKEKAGRIVFDGKPYPYKKRRELCYMTMQDVVHQLFSDSVWEEFSLLNKTVDEQEITKILRRLDLLDYKDKHPMTLSGGQKQRLALAVATLANKDIMIFDEPTSGLDYGNMIKVCELIKELSSNIVVLPVPAEKQDLAYLPDRFETGERVQTPRGSFQVTAMSRKQMEAAGYGVHHISDDGKYLIMGNGTRAFAVAAEQPEKDNPLRTAEMTLEDDYGMIDGVINNGRRGEELEKAQEYAERTTPEKSSIRERLEDAKRECAEHKPQEGKKPGRDVPEHDCL